MSDYIFQRKLNFLTPFLVLKYFCPPLPQNKQPATKTKKTPWKTDKKQLKNWYYSLACSFEACFMISTHLFLLKSYGTTLNWMNWDFTTTFWTFGWRNQLNEFFLIQLREFPTYTLEQIDVNLCANTAS